MSHYTTAAEPAGQTACDSLLTEDWERVLEMLPVDLEASARATAALQRRRGARSAADLLRLVLGYVLCDWSLRLTGLWALLLGLGNLSDVAILKRLRKARTWLGRLVAACIFQHHLLRTYPGVRLRIVDATVICQPKSAGVDWRVHLSFDLGQLSLDGVEITDAHGGEALSRLGVQAGEITVADRGYAQGGELVAAALAGQEFVVRIGARSLALRSAGGRPFDLLSWLRHVPGTEAKQGQVWVQTTRAFLALRLIACRLPAQAVERARRQIRQRARKKGWTPRKETLEIAGFLLIVTNLPEEHWSAAQVVELYRVRWQVEIAIKRLKSIWQLDHLRARDTELAQTYLLGKLLGALLGDALTRTVQASLPEWFADPGRPLSLWRLQQVWFAWLQRAVNGGVALEVLLNKLSLLSRYLRDAPRKKRRSQLAATLEWLRRLNGTSKQEGSLMMTLSGQCEMALS